MTDASRQVSDAIETLELLDELACFMRRFVVLGHEELVAVALWVAHTHVFGALGITPYLAITSAEMQSGKTVLLEVLGLFVRKPWLTASTSAATLARKVNDVRPTLLLDESDTAFKGDKEYAEALRGVLNSGFKSSGTYSRCEGNGAKLTWRDFGTFCPKAIAGIRNLPDTVADRSIPIRLKRKAPGERTERKRERKIEAEAAPLRDRLIAWAERNEERLSELDLAPLEELPDRSADIWEPLLGIAHIAGEPWSRQARAAAIRLSGREAERDPSIRERLLADVRMIFDESGADRIASHDLAEGLAQIEESPWGESRAGKPVTQTGVANLLRPFGITSRSIRLPSGRTPKGYLREQFEDAWRRHLPRPPDVSATTPQPAPLSERETPETRRKTGPVAEDPRQHGRVGQSDVAPVATGELVSRRAQQRTGRRKAEPRPLAGTAYCFDGEADPDAEFDRIKAKFPELFSEAAHGRVSTNVVSALRMTCD